MHTDPIKWSDVRRRVQAEGESIRAVARADGMSRNTVRKMLRQVQPTRYVRARPPTSIDAHKQLIGALLLADEARPQCERQTVAAIFRLLTDSHGYLGGYGSVARYCRNVRVPKINFVVRPAGVAGKINSLTIVKAPRTYRLDPSATPGSAIVNLHLHLHRDRRSERAAEVASWIDQLRGDRLGLPPRGDPAVISRLLKYVHDKKSRTRNRAITALAHEQGFPLRRITACLGVSRNTSRRYLRAYQDGGVDKLLAPTTRRPPGVDRDDLKAAVFRLLHEPPKDHGINRTSWIMADLRTVLAEKGFPACLHVIRRIIHEAGWKWRKARIVLTSNDPAYREKLSAVQAILSGLSTDEAFFSIDEFGPFAVKMKQD